MEIRFHRAQPQDEDAVLEMMRGLYAHHDMAHPPEAQAAVRQALETDHLAHVWLMEVDGGAVGYFALTFGFSLEFGGRYGFIDELFVVPDRRGRGLGAQALAFVEEEARRLGMVALFLEADREGADVQRFYRRHGYARRRYDLLFKRLGEA